MQLNTKGLQSMTPNSLATYKPTTPDLAQLLSSAYLGYVKARTYSECDTDAIELEFIKAVLPDVLVGFRFRTPLCFYWVHSWLDYKASDATNIDKVLASQMLVRFILEDMLPEPIHSDIANELGPIVTKDMRGSFMLYILEGMRGNWK